MDLQDCKKKLFVKEINPDQNYILALKKMIQKKVKASELIPEDLGESKITLIYDAIRMKLEYLALSKGFKIYNHECYTSFLKEILNETRLGDEFDNYRKIRNSINYYGKELNLEETKELFIQMKKFLEKLE